MGSLLSHQHLFLNCLCCISMLFLPNTESPRLSPGIQFLTTLTSYGILFYFKINLYNEDNQIYVTCPELSPMLICPTTYSAPRFYCLIGISGIISSIQSFYLSQHLCSHCFPVTQATKLISSTLLPSIPLTKAIISYCTSETPLHWSSLLPSLSHLHCVHPQFSSSSRQ